MRTSRRDKPNVYIHARLVAATEKAIRIQPANQENFFWLPKSQVVNIEEAIEYLTMLPEADAEVEYLEWEVKEWIATKNSIPTIDETGRHEEVEPEEDFDFDEPF